MTPDDNLFNFLGGLSETVLLASVNEYAQKKDLPSLMAFIDYVPRSSLALEVFKANESAYFQSKAMDMEDIMVTNGLNDPKEHTYSAALVLALSAQANEIGICPVDQLDAAQQDYFKAVLQLGAHTASPDVWNHAVTLAVARTTNAPELFRIMEQSAISLEKVYAHQKAASNAKKPLLALACEALLHGNVALGAQWLSGLDDKEFRVAAEQLQASIQAGHGTDSTSPSEGKRGLMASLRDALLSQPAQVLSLLNVLDSRHVFELSVRQMRARLVEAYLKERDANKEPVNTDLILAVMGETSQRREDFIAWAAQQSYYGAEGFFCQLVKSHQHTVLELFDDTLSIMPGCTPPAGLWNALEFSAAKISNEEGRSRFRLTLEYLIAKGHDLGNVMPDMDASALKYLAMNGEGQDRLEKLRVLLELGADPRQRDKKRKWLPVSYVKVEEKPAWLALERAVAARKSSYDVLAQIAGEKNDFGPIDAGVMKRKR